MALATLPDGAGAHAIRRGHTEGRQRSLAALALATGDALPRVHFRSRLGSRRAKHYRRRAPRNLNTCGNEPEGTPVSDLTLYSSDFWIPAILRHYVCLAF